MKYFLQAISAFLLCNYIQSSNDNICNSQKEIIGEAFKKNNPITRFIFNNDTKTSVQVTWAGDNSGKIILVTTKEVKLLLTFADLSDIYFSDNNGKTFDKITEKLPKTNIIVRKNNGLQRSSINNHNIFLVCHNTIERSSLLITQDGGVNWKNIELDFILDQEIGFHPTNKDYLLTLNTAGQLHRSMDGGHTWTLVLSDVQQYQWSTNKKFPNDIFVKAGKTAELSFFEKVFQVKFGKPEPVKLKKSTDCGSTWKTIKDNIFGFLLRDKFLYVSEMVRGNRRRLSVSIDDGANFNHVYLPTILNTQFYSIMDIEEDLVFIHVDNEDNRGDGTLFSSDSEGRVFSQSLMNHFYPVPGRTNDFYKVKSMRGTYFASQLKPDRSIQTLVTFNRGAEWQLLRKPINETCHDKEKTECYLQITGTFSLENQVPSYLPLSSETAIGLILAHGHLADSLKNTKSDVFISNDGGYNWFKGLNGPYEYVIADHGGLLVALGENKQIIKFSTDEGRCWHEHQYTTEDIHITGLLTEPGNKAMTVLIWGFTKSNSQWIIHVVDLSQLLGRECNSEDYEKWYAHSEMMHPLGTQYAGCLLGKKEVFLKLKKDSLCRNGYSHKVDKKEEICPCTEDDFECEYGYYRTINSKTCVKNEMIKENICVKGIMEQIITQGYKKIPSDVCVGGFSPDKTKQKMLNQSCSDDDNSWITQQAKKNDTIIVDHKPKTAQILKQVDVQKVPSKIVAISVTGGILVFFFLCLGFIILSRRRIIRNRTSNLKYKVLAGLSGRETNRDGDDEALISNETGYESISPSKLSKTKSKLGNDDSDVDMIG